MNLLITGAFGSLGQQVVSYLLKSNHKITCFSTESKRSRKVAKKYRKKVKIIFGDIRNKNDLKKAVQNQDVVIHLAAIVPPRFNYESLDYSYDVNVKETQNLIQLLEEKHIDTKIIYPSSVAVFGDVRHKGKTELKPTDPTNPNDNDIYAQHKVLCEECIQESNLTWAIFRFGFIPALDSLKFDPMMYDVPLDTNMEIIHVKDAAKAIVNALSKEAIWGKILHIAGGEKCRATYKEFVSKMLDTMGLPKLPDKVFGDNDFHCGYMDTEYSQKLLHYQKHSLNDLFSELKQKTTLLRIVVFPFRPFIRWFLIKKSPYI